MGNKVCSPGLLSEMLRGHTKWGSLTEVFTILTRELGHKAEPLTSVESEFTFSGDWSFLSIKLSVVLNHLMSVVPRFSVPPC
jgi:hypothetical protein